MAEIKRYKKNDGTTAFMFNAYVGKHPRTGKNVYRKRQGFKTKKQAQIALAEILKDIDENGLHNEKKPMSFDELYQFWFKQHQLNVKGSSANSYKRWYENNIKGVLGNSIIKDLSVSFCQSVVNQWFYDGTNSYKRYRQLAIQILNFAVSMELIDSNPMSKTILPRKKEVDEKPLQYYTKSDLEKFFNALVQEENYMRLTFFRVLAFTGMRKGEVLALQWEDIDFKKKYLSITKTVSRDVDGNRVINSPKTRASIRDISLDDETLKVLSKWRIMQRSDYLRMGFNTSNEKQFIFTNEQNEFYQGETVTGWLSRVIKKYDLPKITPHHLRHTHASLLLQSGVPIKVISERLGHDDTSITDRIYAHVMPEEKEKTAEKFANFVGF